MSKVDSLLAEWDARYNAQAKRPKLKNEQLRPGRSGSAASARAALAGLAKKTPQVVVKITGGGKSSAAVAAHLRYIGRHGKLDLEDHEGVKHAGAGGRQDIMERWEAGGLPAESRYKEAFNIVLSSPKGASSAAVLRAARDFAQEQFGGRHDFAMALHCPETDPSAKKSENAHVHLVVRARGYDGKKLNPRKADLHSYRQAYARHLRAHGIEVIAVRRDGALNTKHKGACQPVHHMMKRGALGAKKTSHTAVQRALRAEDLARELYGNVMAALSRSQQPGDKVLSESLGQLVPKKQQTVLGGRRRGR